MSFLKFKLSPALLLALEKEEYQSPTPIQDQVIPLVLQRQDVIGEAQTGSGKTASFALPILHILSESIALQKGVPRVLVLTPTRELALQVAGFFKTYGHFLKPELKVVTIIGGENIDHQIRGLRNGCDILVATPGRLIDLMDHHGIKLTHLEILVIDEADKMLNLGFSKELALILKTIPKTTQNLLFSATFPNKVQSLTQKILKTPTHIRIQVDRPTVETIQQRVIEVNDHKKRELLKHFVNTEKWDHVLVFVASQTAARNLSLKLTRDGVQAECFHGGLSQQDRTDILKEFKNKKIKILVATDLASRGLDIQSLPYVVNYDLPRSPEDYIHRIGRTGRAGESGSAISFISHEDQRHFRLIEKRAKINLTRESIPGFELTGEPLFEEKGFAPVKGKRKSKKDKLREKLKAK